MNKAVYPGSFDPITTGHLDIIKRATRIFDEITVLIMVNVNKSGLLSYEQRKELVQMATAGLDKVEVKISRGLLTDYLQEYKISTIVKGLRNVTDFDYEQAMALINTHLDPEVDSVYLIANPNYSMVSSSVVRELLSYHADLSGLVPENIRDTLIKMVEEKAGNGCKD